MTTITTRTRTTLLFLLLLTPPTIIESITSSDSQQQQQHHEWSDTFSHPHQMTTTSSSTTLITTTTTTTSSPYTTYDKEEKKMIDTDTMALALRLTCETNRRLRIGSGDVVWGSTGRRRRMDQLQHLHMDTIDNVRMDHPPPTQASSSSSSSSWMSPTSISRGGGGGGTADMIGPNTATTTTTTTTAGGVSVHPNREWKPPIRLPNSYEIERVHSKCDSIFHRSEQLSASKKGIERWGPNLKEYLQTLATTLGCSDSPEILALTLIYLDRACSVSFPLDDNEQQQQQQACPFVSARTVHRLVLTSMVLACRVVRNEVRYGEEGMRMYAEKLSQVFGISMFDLSMFEECFLSSVGGWRGLDVEEGELNGFLNAWSDTFFGRDDDRSGGGGVYEEYSGERYISRETPSGWGLDA